MPLTTHIDSEQWQSLLEQSAVASWWQSQDCLEMYRLQTDTLQPFSMGVEREGTLVAVCIGYITKSPALSRRAIIYGGPLLQDDCSADEVTLLMNAVAEHCSAKGAVYVETRNFADYSAHKDAFRQAGFAYHPHYDITIDISSWREHLHRSPKANIRKALSQNETWRLATTEVELQQWYQLLHQLYRSKVHRPLPSFPFFLRAWQHKHAILLITLLGDHITGGALLTVLPATSNRQAMAYEWFKCGQIMATYASLEWCEQQQIALYDMMGAGAPGVPYGVRDFKLQIGGELHEYGRYIALMKPLIYRLGKAWIELRSK